MVLSVGVYFPRLDLVLFGNDQSSMQRCVYSVSCTGVECLHKETGGGWFGLEALSLKFVVPSDWSRLSL